MANFGIQDLTFMDAEEEMAMNSGCASAPQVPARGNRNSGNSSSRNQSNTTNGHDQSSRVAMATTMNRSSSLTATLHIVPNIVDASDTESVVENDYQNQRLNPHLDPTILNNLDKKSNKISAMDDADKYLIPDDPDKIMIPDDDKYLIPDDPLGNDTDKFMIPDDPDKYLIPDDPDKYLIPDDTLDLKLDDKHLIPDDPLAMKGEERHHSTPHSIDGDMFPEWQQQSRWAHQLPRPGGLDTSSAADTSAAASRRSSVSSLASEVGRRSSDASTSKKKKRRHSLRPRIKSNFADVTLEYIRDRLHGRIFSGWLEEKRRLETVVRAAAGGGGELVEGWRDVVEVDGCELDMVQQLAAVLASVPGAKEGKKWINITAPGSVQGYLLWVVLGAPRPPGHYWYRVAGVSSHPSMGLLLQLAIIRSVGESDSESSVARNRRQAAAAATAAGDLPLSLSIAWDQLFASVKDSCTAATLGQYAAIMLHPSNLAYAIRMLVFAVVSTVLGIMHGGREAARLFLMLIRETGTLIDRATPLVQILVACFEKLIGGMYLLIAMVYKDIRRTPPDPRMMHPQQQQQLMYSGNAGGKGGRPSYGGARRYVGPNNWDSSS